MRLVALSLALLLLFASSQTFAQLPGQARPRDLQILELDMARASYDLVKNPQNLEKLVGLYKKMIEQDCMGGDQSVALEKRELPLQTDCGDFIKALLELDPKNAVAICARDGIAAQTCVNAKAGISDLNLPTNPIDALEQYLDRPAIPSSINGTTDSSSSVPGQAPEYQPDYKILEAATLGVQNAVREFQATGSETAKKHLNESYIAYLEATCPPPKKVLYDKKFSAWRKAVPENCKNFGQRVLENDPENKFAKCFTEGYLSIPCKEHVAGIGKTPSPDGATPKKESFDKF